MLRKIPYTTLIASILLLVSGLNSQAQSVKWLRDIPLEYGEKLAAIDKYGSVYTFMGSVVTKRDSIRKYVYQNTGMGAPQNIELQNPLKPLLFYPNFNAAIILDNLFNEIETLSFQNLDPNLVASAVFTAAQNNLWICNETDQKIYRYELQSRKLQPLTQNLRLNAKWFAADLNFLYWNDAENYLWKLNFFGNMSSDLAIPAFEQLQLLENYGLIYSFDGKIFTLDYKNKQIKNLELPINNFQSFAVKGQFLAIFTESQIKVYYLNIP